MGMGISSRLRGKVQPREPDSSEVLGLARLAQTLGTSESVPVLVLRVPFLERLAWREGRSAARRLERQCLTSFRETGRRVLRASDLLAHDDESELFVAALAVPPRDRPRMTSIDCRAALSRLSTAMEYAAGVDVECGWTFVRNVGVGDPLLTVTVEAALERGARERERYAFFSAVGHELRTPLTSVCGYLDTLLGEPLDAATTQRFLEIARAEALRLGRLVEGMFALSMLDLQETLQRGEVGACDAVQALCAAIDATAPTARLREATVTLLETPDRAPLLVAASLERVVQTAVNLLDNALKHGSRGGRVEVSARCGDGRFVEMRVEDDGPGVPPAERDTIFALGGRGADATAAGSGIGLAAARLIVERMGGEIVVGDSALGGALFCVRLPTAGHADREPPAI